MRPDEPSTFFAQNLSPVAAKINQAILSQPVSWRVHKFLSRSYSRAGPDGSISYKREEEYIPPSDCGVLYQMDARTQKIVKILREEVFTKWGVPKYLVCDRGPQFTSSTLANLCKTWGCLQRLTTSYHPQANLTERINRTVKTVIAAFVGQQHQPWDQ